MKSKKQTSLADAIQRHLRARESGKRAYKRAERLLDELAERMKPGEEVELGAGKKAVLKDLYAETNKVYRAHGIARYEIEVVEE